MRFAYRHPQTNHNLQVGVSSIYDGFKYFILYVYAFLKDLFEDLAIRDCKIEKQSIWSTVTQRIYYYVGICEIKQIKLRNQQ